MGPIRKYWMWAAVLAVASVAFFGSPGDYSGTPNAILNGFSA